MNKYRYLLKNIGLLTLSNFGSKILNIIIVPLYTSILTTEEYGTFDLFYTTISLLIPILTINLYDAVLRFSLDKKNDIRDMMAISIKIFIGGLLILVLTIGINWYFNFFAIFNKYIIYFFLLYISTGLYTFLTSFSKGLEKITPLSIAGIISTISILLFNIIFLLVLKISLRGYFIANILGNLIPSIYLIIKLKIWKYFTLKVKDKSLEKEMIKYSKPLVLNSVSWWINSALDRYIIIWLCGMSDNGIYSVGYKIPSMLNMFSNIFNQAWILSSVKAFDKDDKGGFFGSVYSVYNFLLVLLCSIMIVCTQLLAKILFAKDFYLAWKYIPFLLISVIFGALSGFIGGIFSAVKDSKIYALSTSGGAIINMLLNIILIKEFGTIGAAIATAISYCIVWLIRYINIKKYMNMDIYIKRDIFAYIILFVQSILLISITNILLKTIIEFCMFLIILVLYYNEIRKYFGIKKIKVFLKYKEKRIGILKGE